MAGYNPLPSNNVHSHSNSDNDVLTSLSVSVTNSTLTALHWTVTSKSVWIEPKAIQASMGCIPKASLI